MSTHKPTTLYRQGGNTQVRRNPNKDSLTVVGSFLSTTSRGDTVLCITAWSRGAYHFTREQAKALLEDINRVLGEQA